MMQHILNFNSAITFVDDFDYKKYYIYINIHIYFWAKYTYFDFTPICCKLFVVMITIITKNINDSRFSLECKLLCGLPRNRNLNHFFSDRVIVNYYYLFLCINVIIHLISF